MWGSVGIGVGIVCWGVGEVRGDVGKGVERCGKVCWGPTP